MTNELVVSKSDIASIDLKRSFDERLRSVELTEDEARGEIVKATQKIVRDKAAGLFKITDLINTVFKMNEETSKALKALKRDKLLETYFALTESNEATVSQLKNFLTSGSGNVLFNKIINIIDDAPPEQEMINHLAATLTHIVDSDFNLLFSAHKHALSQIGRLTPQALTILSDAQNWPPFALSSRTTDGGIVQSEWNKEFCGSYARVKKISEPKAILRISHSVFELQGSRLLLAAQDGDIFRCHYTEIGNEIRTYLTV